MSNVRSRSKKQVDPFESIPIGEVSEGNSELDWAQWEDSVAFQEGKIPTTTSTYYARPLNQQATGAQGPGADRAGAFSSVTKAVFSWSPGKHMACAAHVCAVQQ